MKYTNPRTSARSSFQAGFTLVEIMVAITLSMFLIAGLVQIYSSSKRSSTLQQTLAEYQENQRFSLDLLSRDLRMAGFFDQSIQTSIKPVPKFYLNALDSTDPLNTTNHPGDGSDVLTVQYESATDCLGHSIDKGETGFDGPNGKPIAINMYYVQLETLYCNGNGGVGGQPLIEGVVNMQVLFGEDLGPIKAGEQPTADRYVTIGNVSKMERIKTVRIALLFKTPTPIKDKAESVTYKLLDAPEITANDKYRREVVTTTIALRN